MLKHHAPSLETQIKNLLTASEPSQDSGIEVNDQYTHTLKKVHLVESFQDGKEWELNADIAHSQKNGAAWLLSNVRVRFFEESTLGIHVTGDWALFTTSQRKLHIYGNVVAETENGYKIKTQDLFYTSNDRQLFSEGAVDIIRQSSRRTGATVIKGGYMRTSMKDSMFTLGNGVSAAQGRTLGGGLEVKSGEARLSKEKSSVEFYDKVHMSWGDSEFQGQSAELRYNSAEDELEEVLLVGQVQIISDTRFASCERARLSMREGITELSGRPKVIEAGNQVEGEKIILNHENNTVKVEQMRARFGERDGR